MSLSDRETLWRMLKLQVRVSLQVGHPRTDVPVPDTTSGVSILTLVSFDMTMSMMFCWLSISGVCCPSDPNKPSSKVIAMWFSKPESLICIVAARAPAADATKAKIQERMAGRIQLKRP